MFPPIRAITGTNHKQLDLALPQVGFAYNSMVNRSVQKTPFSIVYTKSLIILLILLSCPSLKATLLRHWLTNFKRWCQKFEGVYISLMGHIRPDLINIDIPKVLLKMS